MPGATVNLEDIENAIQEAKESQEFDLALAHFDELEKTKWGLIKFQLKEILITGFKINFNKTSIESVKVIGEIFEEHPEIEIIQIGGGVASNEVMLKFFSIIPPHFKNIDVSFDDLHKLLMQPEPTIELCKYIETWKDIKQIVFACSPSLGTPVPEEYNSALSTQVKEALINVFDSSHTLEELAIDIIFLKAEPESELAFLKSIEVFKGVIASILSLKQSFSQDVKAEDFPQQLSFRCKTLIQLLNEKDSGLQNIKDKYSGLLWEDLRQRKFLYSQITKAVDNLVPIFASMSNQPLFFKQLYSILSQCIYHAELESRADLDTFYQKNILAMAFRSAYINTLTNFSDALNQDLQRHLDEVTLSTLLIKLLNLEEDLQLSLQFFEEHKDYIDKLQVIYGDIASCMREYNLPVDDSVYVKIVPNSFPSLCNALRSRPGREQLIEKKQTKLIKNQAMEINSLKEQVANLQAASEERAAKKARTSSPTAFFTPRPPTPPESHDPESSSMEIEHEVR